MSRFLGPSIVKILSKVNKTNHVSQRYRTAGQSKNQTNESASPYVILKATKDDHIPLLKLMHNTYFIEEPTCYSLRITRNPVLDERALSAMAEGMTVVARCKYTGCLVGASVNESTHAWDPDITEKFACSVRCPKVRQLMLFYAHLQRLPDIWKKYNVNKVFEVSMLFVHKHHRKKGIAYRLLQQSRETAADCGFKVLRCDATNAYTAHLCRKLQMKEIGEIPYASYLSRNLEQIFQPPYPHESVKIFVDVHPQLKKENIGTK